MKNFFRIIGIITFVGLAAYACYLLYLKLIAITEDDFSDDLEDDTCEYIPFSARVRAAAEKHLAKAR